MKLPAGFAARLAALRAEHGLWVIAFASPISIGLTNTAFVVTSLLALRDWRAGRLRVSPTPLDAAIAVWVAAALLAALASLDPWESLRDLRNLGHWAIYYVAVWVLRGGAPVATPLLLWFAGGGVAALAAMSQGLLGFDPKGRREPSVSGMFRGHLTYAHYVATQLGALLSAFAEARDLRRQAVVVCAFALLGGALVLSDARGAWVALAAVAGFWVLYEGRWRLGVAVLVAMLVLQFAGFGGSRERAGAWYRSLAVSQPWQGAGIDHGIVYSNIWRVVMWREGLITWSARPVLGTGVETTGDLSQGFHTPFEDFGVAHLHSNYLEILMTRGYVGLVATLYLWLAIGRCLLGGLSRAGPGAATVAVWAGLAAVGVHAVHGLSYFSIGSAPNLMGFYLALGLAVGAIGRGEGDPADFRLPPATGWIFGVAAMLLVDGALRDQFAISILLGAGACLHWHFVGFRRGVGLGGWALWLAAVVPLAAGGWLLPPTPEGWAFASAVFAAVSRAFAVAWVTRQLLVATPPANC